MTFLYLTAEEVLAVAEHACGDMRVAVRDIGLLESAVHRPSASMFGTEAYADLFDKAAALLQSLAINPPLVDGNKRTAWLSCVTFLSLNGERLRPDVDAAESLVIAVATGELEDIKLIGERLRLLRDTGDP
ncbi:type II toxin-antitoxin system death-on-curing family toxin [Streptomyces verrucosisporus]|uniref:type II toxin-antitoxin system death-on-curing family toxin n=1 Tax=Streptomyces verrucosisporus TaxID=1695161 RepID=UPI0019D133E7|nr:type II toxin-antitoxin system death-on-curing family toxin [Streptomyces verrucosisporus]MBN3930288.1 type II toxin-antitoxin system death-on-curing family toxin [Streptomyces verrucosisporus]